MKRMTAVILLVLLCAGLAGAQDDAKSSVFWPTKAFQVPTGFLSKLLDSSRFSMSQSYTLSFGKMGPYSLNTGLYLNTMNLRIADPLTMQVRVGLMHPLGGGTNNLYQAGTKLFVQRAMLQYQPSENFKVVIDYQAFPSAMMSPYGVNPYGYGPFGYDSSGW